MVIENEKLDEAAGLLEQIRWKSGAG